MLTQHLKFSSALGLLPMFVTIFCGAAVASVSEPAAQLSPANIFPPASTPAQSIFGLAIFVLAVDSSSIRGRLHFAGLLGREVQEKNQRRQP
jgi:hypothetical protein